MTARRGRQKTIYSDNARAFKVGAKWLKKVIKDKKFCQYLNQVSCKFNIWVVRQFECMIGLPKQSLYQSKGKAQLTFSELWEVLLDVEINLNNRPLTYIEHD